VIEEGQRLVVLRGDGGSGALRIREKKTTVSVLDECSAPDARVDSPLGPEELLCCLPYVLVCFEMHAALSSGLVCFGHIRFAEKEAEILFQGRYKMQLCTTPILVVLLLVTLTHSHTQA